MREILSLTLLLLLFVTMFHGCEMALSIDGELHYVRIHGITFDEKKDE